MNRLLDKKRWSINILVLFILAMVSCEEPYADHKLIGKWLLVRDNLNDMDILIQYEGGETQYEFKDDGKFIGQFMDAKFMGSWEAADGVLTIHLEGVSDGVSDYSITGDTLRLVWLPETFDDTITPHIQEFERQ